MATELKTLLHQLIDIDDTAVPAFIAEHRDQLLTAVAIDRLAQLASAAPGPRTQQRIEQRLQALLNRRKQQDFTDLPPDEQLYTLFRQTDNSLALQNLVLQLREGDLNALDDIIAAKHAAADASEQAEIDQRRTVLRQIRADLQAQFGDHLPFIKRINAWLQTNSWQESHDYLRLHKSEMLSDPALAAMDKLITTDPDNPVLLEHRQILQDGQRHGIVRAYANRAEREAATAVPADIEQALTPKLLDWLQQQTLADSETYLQAHAADLLTDHGEAVLRQMVFANAGNPTVRDHYRRLQQARQQGVTPIYAAIRRQRFQQTLAELPERGDVGTAVAHFIQLTDDSAAAATLAATPALRTAAARDLIAQLAAIAATLDDDATAQRLQTRAAQVTSAT